MPPTTRELDTELRDVRDRVAGLERTMTEHRAQSAAQHAETMAAIKHLGETSGESRPRKTGGYTISLAPGSGKELAQTIFFLLTIGGIVSGGSYLGTHGAEVVKDAQATGAP